jgi:hypothetical protein
MDDDVTLSLFFFKIYDRYPTNNHRACHFARVRSYAGAAHACSVFQVIYLFQLLLYTRYMPVRCNGTNMIKYIDMKNTNFELSMVIVLLLLNEWQKYMLLNEWQNQ